MKTTNTFGIQFISRAKKNNPNALLFVRITVNGTRKEISLKTNVPSPLWNTHKECLKGTNVSAKQVNEYIEKTRYRIREIYQDLVQKKKNISAEIIKNIYTGNSEQDKSFMNLLEYHFTNADSVLSPGTIKNYHTTTKYLQKFIQKKFGGADIYLTQLNFQFISEFELFLRSHQPVDHQKGLQNNGVMKHLERLRKVIRLGVKLEWLEKDPFEQFQLKFHRVDRGYLTKEELENIEQKYFAISRLDWVRDLFIFSCYTGLAYIDMIRLKKSSIVIGIDGMLWIKTFRQKTDTEVNVPLLPKAHYIIKKYSNSIKAAITDTVFPVISNQKLNSYLKEIADICGIDKNLTFHLARHTFATTITLGNGVPIETVSKLLGHAKISTTQIYARVVESKISQDMEVLQQRLNKSSDCRMLQVK
jgi:site-specific recombinase XerD